MPKSNAKNIRVFIDWFGNDLKSKQKEVELCQKLFDKIKDNALEWSSDKGGFWIEERNHYYKNICENGKFLNYPIELKDEEIDGSKVIKTQRCWIGKISGNEVKRTVASELDPYYVDAAQKDLKEHPIKEEGFDWGHIKQTLENE